MKIQRLKNTKVILKSLEAMIQAAKVEENNDRRRQILPLPWELKYLEKQIKVLKVLRGDLTKWERKMSDKIIRLEQGALRAYEKGLESIK